MDDFQKGNALSTAKSLLSALLARFIEAGGSDEKIEDAEIAGIQIVLDGIYRDVEESFRPKTANEALGLIAVVKGCLKSVAGLSFDGDASYGMAEIVELISKQVDAEIEFLDGADASEDDVAVDPDDAAKGMLDLLAGKVGWPRILSGFLQGTDEGKDLIREAA